ncbi:hypothetical protein SAMN05518672_10382 [Chitinophaga sp. CF118]|uniref:hypothetical protein n=1 Tax=Chitinophaga sp. CF118 TaxID=1884367 RepID=UPI0008F125C0|nr:hypothetical protein [Chitinophaga sp. CF118]SFD75534.1 hypothetical protein SAMN05518672_10382 [Chitinophaga sp. CF118]
MLNAGLRTIQYISVVKDVINKVVPPVLILIIAGISAYGQTGSRLQQKIVVPAENIRFDSLLHLISKQSGVKFSLNTRKFPPSKIIHVKKGSQPVAQVLADIKAGTGIYYTLLDSHIIFADNPPHKKEEVILPTVHHHKKILPAKPVTVVPLELHSLAGISRSIDTPSIHIHAIHPGKLSQVINNPVSAEKSRIELPLFVKAGVTAEEFFYMNTGIQAGLPFLYGIASYNTNFKYSNFRYGLRTSIRLTDSWRLHLMVTTGNSIKQTYDSSRMNRLVKMRLNKAAVLAERKLGRHFTVQLGLSFNDLQTKYYRNGVEAPLSFPEPTADKRFNFLKPPYSIWSNYSPSSSSYNKLWIGMQIGLFYNIHFFKTRY